MGLLVLALLLLPGRAHTPLDGLPLSGPVELSVLFAALLLGLGLRWRPSSWWGWRRAAIALAVLLLAKGIFGWLSLPQGLAGNVSTTAGGFLPRQETQLSPHTTNDGGARTELFGPIDFTYGASSLRHQTVPIGFFNDVERFNFPGADQPDRRFLPWSAAFEGFLSVDRDETILFFLESNALATVTIDDRLVVSTEGAGGYRETLNFLELTKGLHPIRVQYDHNPASRPLLRLSWQRTDAAREPVPASAFFPQHYPKWRYAAHALAHVGATAVGWLMLVALLALFWTGVDGKKRELIRDPRVQMVLFTFTGYVILLGALWVYGLDADYRVLQAGNDDLMYESNARYLLQSNDWLLRGPEPGPYYYNVLYQYALAVIHSFVGPDLSAVAAVQVMALTLTALVTGKLMQSAFGRDGQPVQLAVLGSLTLFRYTYQFFPIGALPFLVALWLGTKRSARPSKFFLIGVLLGTLIALRTNFFLVVPFFLLWFVVKGRGWQRFSWPAIVLAGLVAVILPITSRNLWVSGQFVLVNNNAGNNLLTGNPIPAAVDLSHVTEQPLYNALHLEPAVRGVLEFARQEPAAFWKLQWEKFQFYWGGRTERPAWYMLLPTLLTVGTVLFALVRKHQLLQRGWLLLAASGALAFGIIFSIAWNPRYSLPIVPVLHLWGFLLMGMLTELVPWRYRWLAGAGTFLLVLWMGVAWWAALPAALFLMPRRRWQNRSVERA